MSFPPGTEMFQFSGFALPKLCIHFGNTLSHLTPTPDYSGARIKW
jgi:hypothetical protein